MGKILVLGGVLHSPQWRDITHNGYISIMCTVLLLIANWLRIFVGALNYSCRLTSCDTSAGDHSHATRGTSSALLYFTCQTKQTRRAPPGAASRDRGRPWPTNPPAASSFDLRQQRQATDLLVTCSNLVPESTFPIVFHFKPLLDLKLRARRLVKTLRNR